MAEADSTRAPRICIDCSFNPTRHGKGPRCSRCDHRRRAKIKAAYLSGEYAPGSYHREAVCEGCGNTFPAVRIAHSRYCSRPCADLHRYHTPEQRIARRRENKRRENERLKAKRAARRALSPPRQKRSRPNKEPRPCKRCGSAFTPAYGDKRRLFCSSECGRLFVKRAVRQIRKYRGRARKHGVRYEAVNPTVVFNRDGWRCQVCGVKTPKRLRGKNKPRSPELDHRVPMAMGGEHTYANTQCCCRTCNAAKGGHTARGQMDLFAEGVRGASSL